jgi:hypothetical protein
MVSHTGAHHQETLRRRAPLLASGALFLALAAATTWAWEPCHDEGVTFAQVFGSVGLSGQTPSRVGDLYAAFDAADEFAPGRVVEALRQGMHPPAYYVFLHTYARLFGTGTLALRVPAYLFGLLSLWGIAAVARRVVPVPGAGGWAALLFAVSPWFIGMTNYLRPYGLALCIALGSTAILLHSTSACAPKPRALARVAFVLLSALGLYTIYHYAFVLVWQFSFLALVACLGPRERRVREFVALTAMGILIALAYAPWLPTLARHLEVTGEPHWYFSREMPAARWPLALAQLLQRFALGRTDLVADFAYTGPIFWVLVAFTAVAFARSVRRRRLYSEDVAARAFWISAPLLPLLIAAADRWHGTHTLFLTKLSFGLFPLLVLALIGSWHAAPDRRLRVVGLAAFAALFAAVSIHNVVAQLQRVSDFERISADLSAANTRSHVVVLSSRTRGYVVPLLLLLRDADAGQLRMGAASRDELPALIDALTSDASVRRISLVGFSLGTDPEWGTRLLGRTMMKARRRGYELREPGRQPGPAVDAASILTLVRGAAVRFCSM